jgi:hypothetical protein
MNEKPYKGRIFLSYAHMDLPQVKRLYRKLCDTGFEPWLDKEDIVGGEDWNLAIRKAIKESVLFIVCLTNNSVNKRGTIQEEIKLALDMWRQKLEDDIYLVPVKLEPCKIPESLAKFQWIDLFKRKGFEKLVNSIKTGMRKLGVILLRSKPFDFFLEGDLLLMLREKDFPHRRFNIMGKGINHNYEPVVRDGKKLVIDHVTDLVWQRSCSKDYSLSFEQALNYVDSLNKEAYGGYDNWRLPTLEEAMSLMENRRRGFLFLDPLFEPMRHSWTHDMAGLLRGAWRAWVVDYEDADCYPHFIIRSYGVRAVR